MSNISSIVVGLSISVFPYSNLLEVNASLLKKQLTVKYSRKSSRTDSVFEDIQRTAEWYSWTMTSLLGVTEVHVSVFQSLAAGDFYIYSS